MSDPELWAWLKRHQIVSPPLPLAGDASLRRYFRLEWRGRSAVLMDCRADPACGERFLKLARRLREGGIRVPEIYLASSPFYLLEDFGTRHYLDLLTPETAEPLYRLALATLERLQRLPTEGLPPYDAGLLERELELFRSWAVERLWRGRLPEGVWEEAKALLIENGLSQPRVFVHRDFHSRNLMLLEGGMLGVLDFQDAVSGPITYDLVSLLRDCYISWPSSLVSSLRERFRLGLRQRGVEVGEATFRRWFDLMGFQRHLKAVGIFARLALRDRKRRYLGAIPRTLGYIETVGRRYRELVPLCDIIQDLCRCSSGVEQLIRNQ